MTYEFKDEIKLNRSIWIDIELLSLISSVFCKNSLYLSLKGYFLQKILSGCWSKETSLIKK